MDDGKTVDLISIGMIREDGKEYYAVNLEMPVQRILKHKWLVQNVWSQLPLTEVQGNEWDNNIYQDLDRNHPDVKPKSQIAQEVEDFILEKATLNDLPELWAWFSSYDHVVLSQLWGSMINLPSGIPMYTKDIRQLLDHKRASKLPAQVGGVHNALEDARHNKVRYDYLITRPWKD